MYAPAGMAELAKTKQQQQQEQGSLSCAKAIGKSSSSTPPPVGNQQEQQQQQQQQRGGIISAPPCIWDEEYPKKQKPKKHLSRSLSEKQRVPPKIIASRHSSLNSSASAVRSLWSAENKEYLEMRFGLFLNGDGGANQRVPMKKEVSEQQEQQLEQQEMQEKEESNKQEQEQGKKPEKRSLSVSSEEASSIFSNPDSSSFSSGSDLSSIAVKEQDEEAATGSISSNAAAPASQESESEELAEEGFLDYSLVQGNLEAAAAAAAAAAAVAMKQEEEEEEELAQVEARRQNVEEESEEVEEARRIINRNMYRRFYSSSCSPKEQQQQGSIRPSFAHEDRYPVWASGNSSSSSNWHLRRSYRENSSSSSSSNSKAMRLDFDCLSERRHVARRLLMNNSPVSLPSLANAAAIFHNPRFHFEPGSFISPKISRQKMQQEQEEEDAPSSRDDDDEDEEATAESPTPQAEAEATSSSSIKQEIQARFSKVFSRNHRQQQSQSQSESLQPDVHCKSFFLKKPAAFRAKTKNSNNSHSNLGYPIPTSASTSTSDGFRTAHLHWVVRHDHHSYTFVVDGSGELLISRTPRKHHQQANEEHQQQQQQQEDEDVCSFYSWKQRKRSKTRSWKPAWAGSSSASQSASASSSSLGAGSNKRECSELVARLRLSRRFTRDALVELEFVLVDASGSHSEELEPAMDDARLSFSSWETRKSPNSSFSASSSSSGISLKKNPWWSLVPSSPGLKRGSKSLSRGSSPSRGKIDEDVDVLRDVWNQMEAAESMRRAAAAAAAAASVASNGRAQELAAFVVTVAAAKNPKNLHFHHSSMDCFPDIAFKSRQQQHLPDDQYHHRAAGPRVRVLLPVGEHGMPEEGIAGPSPLIQRWRSGRCECGGWDLGCAINVLDTDHEQSGSKLLHLSLQGSGKNKRDVFNLVALSNGLFSVQFKEPLSALQAFAAAVAILYRAPSVAIGVNRDLDNNLPLQAIVSAARANAPPWSKVLALPCISPTAPGGGCSSLHLERL